MTRIKLLISFGYIKHVITNCQELFEFKTNINLFRYPTFQFLVEMRTHKKSAVHMLLYHENFDSRSSGILNIDPLQTTGPGLADKIQNFNNLYFRNWVS